jgi:hypothetical protein
VLADKLQARLRGTASVGGDRLGMAVSWTWRKLTGCEERCEEGEKGRTGGAEETAALGAVRGE